MPVVLRVDGFVFGFFAGDHEPPHVHVWYAGNTAILEIETGRARTTALRRPELAKAQALLRAHRDELLAEWLAWKQKRKEGE